LSGAAVPEEEALLRRLSSLGFTEQQARPVLSACGGDVERAVELIVSSACDCATETPAPAEGVPPEPGTASEREPEPEPKLEPDPELEPESEEEAEFWD
jgi:hypothetical protein